MTPVKLKKPITFNVLNIENATLRTFFILFIIVEHW